MAFSPDSRRIASGSLDGTVRVWDAAGGQELLSLQGRSGQVHGVAFSPDGGRLASLSDDGTVRVWEASPVPAEVWRERGLVSDVQALFTKLLFREEVLAALRTDPALSEADREFALQVAQTHSEDALALAKAAWAVVKSRDAGKDAYTAALRRAVAAVRLAPGNGEILNTLGVAQYRAGRYADALTTLTKSEKLNATEEFLHHLDLAFQAMARHRLGQGAEAKATLARLPKVKDRPGWAPPAGAREFLREAEELIEGKAVDKKP
jgi:tetratricopeptide (TPR) repeat protein